MARNIGGNENTEGEGYVPICDAVTPNLTNPNANKAVSAQTSIRTPYTFERKVYEPTLSQVGNGRKQIVGDYDNVLTVHPIYRNSSTYVDYVSAEVETIAKPFELRAIKNNSSILHITPSRRYRYVEVDGGTLTLIEIISPPYTAGDTIAVATMQDTGVVGVPEIDLNLAARRWENEEPLTKRFIIKAIHKDYFDCYAYVNATEMASGAYIKVAKPDNLRGTYWGSLSWYDGTGYITYADDSGGTDWASRVATRSGDSATEDQVITPPWLPDYTIITASRMDIGTGVASVLWQDNNNGNHAFAKVVE